MLPTTVGIFLGRSIPFSGGVLVETFPSFLVLMTTVENKTHLNMFSDLCDRLT